MVDGARLAWIDDHDPHEVEAVLWGTDTTTASELIARWCRIARTREATRDDLPRVWLTANASALGFPPAADVPDRVIAEWLADRHHVSLPALRPPAGSWISAEPHLLIPRPTPQDATRHELATGIAVHDVTGTTTPSTGLLDIARIGALLPHRRRFLYGLDPTPPDGTGLDRHVWLHTGKNWPVFPVTMVWRSPSVLTAWCGWTAHPLDPTTPTSPFGTTVRPDLRRPATR